MSKDALSCGYRYSDGKQSHSHNYLLPVITDELHTHFARRDTLARRVFDLGCGNGTVASELTQKGYEVVGVDPSEEGIKQANRHFPALRLEVGSGYDDLHARYGQFPAVVSLEVVEHVYAPRAFASTLFALVEPHGVALVTTPYHGYFKNLALAVGGRMDAHFTALWDHGHIKFWSMETLGQLLREAGFAEVRFRRAGRIPALAKSMIAIASKV